ncbi:MAG: hypothetical protein ACRDMU_02855 [Gaiellaceae bacterium]
MPTNPDACPNCGENVAALISYSVGTRAPGQEMRPPDTQSKRCPNCGTYLRRGVEPGEPWRVDERRDPDPDDCPECHVPVEWHGNVGPATAGETVVEPSETEVGRCPNCERVLVRPGGLGLAWREEEPG